MCMPLVINHVYVLHVCTVLAIHDGDNFNKRWPQAGNGAAEVKLSEFWVSGSLETSWLFRAYGESIVLVEFLPGSRRY